MIKDFFYTYSGFNGTPSQCHIRIVSEHNKPTVVVCSATPSNTGTSVTNAYEIIRDSVFDELKNKEESNFYSDLNNKEGSGISAASLLDEFNDTLLKTKKIRVAMVYFLLSQASKALKNKTSSKDLPFQDINENEVVWIEHWPLKTGLSMGKSDYSLVKESNNGEPNWQRVPVYSLAKELGYEVSAIEKKEEIFQKP